MPMPTLECKRLMFGELYSWTRYVCETRMPPKTAIFWKLWPWPWPWQMTLNLIPTKRSYHEVYSCEIYWTKVKMLHIYSSSKIALFLCTGIYCLDITLGWPLVLIKFKHIYFTSIEKQVPTTYTILSRFCFLGTTPVLAPNVWANEKSQSWDPLRTPDFMIARPMLYLTTTDTTILFSYTWKLSRAQLVTGN